MAKKNKQKRKVETPKAPNLSSDSLGFWQNARWHKWIVFATAFLLYANTLTHDYTQDDAIVIYDNMFTQDGFSGIPGLLTKDTFFGFFKVEGKAKLVAGGRYRPLTPVMFAAEWQIFGRNPFIGHLINVILFGLLCVLLYHTLSIMLLSKSSSYTRFLVFVATMIFVAHPIHTEVVANIKGRDEIMSMMGALMALFATFKYHYTQHKKWFGIALLSMFLGLLSKENTITFLAVIPAALLLFTNSKVGEVLVKTVPLLLPVAIFLVIRTSILGLDMGDAPRELMNNPYLKIENNQFIPFTGSEKIATISYTLGKYIQLLIFPHPLTHDYYPRHVEIMSFGSWKVILSLLAYLALIFSVFYFWKRNKIYSFSAFYFIATLSIVSNIVFPIGTNMSERFLFMPSVGFALAAAYLLEKLYINSKAQKISLVIIATLLGLYSLKTITRNMVWKDDFTLFTTDVHTSKRSAKILNAAGGALLTESIKLKDGAQKTDYINRAIGHLKDAIEIHPRYKNAFLLLGNGHYYKEDFDEAIKYYDYTLEIDPDYPDGLRNLAISLRDGGRHNGEKLNNMSKAEKYLKRSYGLNPTDYETVRLLGITYGIKGEHKNAIKYFEEAIAIEPNLAVAYASLGTAYLNFGDEEMARINFNKAVEIDPNALNNLKTQ